ncbi:hypothetical protein JOE59_003186 [Agromyces cerinus]|uniref:hypothetical protein n=1 Tax=Agromyces cerinus TaxID=33878 RepID=UPI001959B890|nr:hypothetical protein [Agromyces cerinus]MBM7832481.1 hypothetical protein [Agromyces cerinus]
MLTNVSEQSCSRVLARVRRQGIPALIVCVLAIGVSGCSRAPNEAELAGAAEARDDGHRALAGFDFTAPSGFTRAAHRTVDACGSPTSDRDGLDDRHVEGYECFAVERVVYTPADDVTVDLDTAIQQLGAGLGAPATERWDGEYFVSDRIQADGYTVLVDVSRELIDEPSTVDDLPVQGWLANDVVHEDDGDLLDRLPELVASGESEVIVATVSVRYFRDAPGAPD